MTLTIAPNYTAARSATDSYRALSFFNVKIEDISSAYSGRPGCACGCRGKHMTGQLSINRVAKRVCEWIEDAIELGQADPTYQVDVVPGLFISVETNTRLYVLYTDNK